MATPLPAMHGMCRCVLSGLNGAFTKPSVVVSTGGF
jgi:hypothetical protein